MKNENLVPVYTKQLALSLRRLGYHIIKTEPNDRFPQFDIYYFEDAKGENQMSKDLDFLNPVEGHESLRRNFPKD